MKKKFDCVEFQRQIRKKLSEQYWKSSGSEIKELRQKFGHLLLTEKSFGLKAPRGSKNISMA